MVRTMYLYHPCPNEATALVAVPSPRFRKRVHPPIVPRFSKVYPPYNHEAERRYKVPHPFDLKKVHGDEYYVVTRGQAVGVFVDWYVFNPDCL